MDFMAAIAFYLKRNRSGDRDKEYIKSEIPTWKKNSKSLEAGSRLITFSSSALIDNRRRWSSFQCKY
jgi:hypothetical protein